MSLIHIFDAVNDLDIRNDNSVRRFKRRIRANFETFLRFTHRYWFHELSERPHVQAMYRLCSNHLRNDGMYDNVRDEIKEMSHYLDSDSQRRQSNTVVPVSYTHLDVYKRQPLDGLPPVWFRQNAVTQCLSLIHI